MTGDAYQQEPIVNAAPALETAETLPFIAGGSPGS
jgi:hypothetical protein